MRCSIVLACVVVGVLATGASAGTSAADRAKLWADGVEFVNAVHAEDPGKTVEADLAQKVPARARKSLERLLDLDDDEEGLADALLVAGEAAWDLDLADDFGRVRERLAAVAPDRVEELGVLVSRDRFVVRGVGGLGAEYLANFADVFDTILTGYDKVFGFAEWSKVPGKKLRVRVRLVPKITRPPHFAPQFKYHSEIDFPVADASAFNSPTPDGKFLFYGLCHELGHVIAMWGNRQDQADHHAWAHYTGVVLVEHLAKSAGKKKHMKPLRDVKWRSLELDRKTIEKDGTEPSTKDRAGVMALLLALHDAVGPEKIGAAINHLDAEDKRLRINRVRYYTFAELRDGLLAVCKSKRDKKRVRALLD